MSNTALYRRNVGGLDRWIRLLLGAPLVAAGLFVAGGTRGAPIGISVALLGLVGVLTAITARCPLYVPFGISTARIPASHAGSVCQEWLSLPRAVSREPAPSSSRPDRKENPMIFRRGVPFFPVVMRHSESTDSNG